MTTKVFTVSEVAGILRVKERTVLEYLRQRRLMGMKMGGRVWRITEGQVEAFIVMLQEESKVPKPWKKRVG